VYPGFIDAQTTVGLEDPGAGNFGDANECSTSIRAFARSWRFTTTAMPFRCCAPTA
jgi:hypothetical protein